MTTTLDSIELTHDPVYVNEYSDPRVSANVSRGLGGGVYVQEFVRMESGRLIDLEGCLVTKNELDSLKTLSERVLITFDFSMENGDNSISKVVRFRAEQNGGLDFRMIAPRTGYPGSDMLYSGNIYLMVI